MDKAVVCEPSPNSVAFPTSVASLSASDLDDQGEYVKGYVDFDGPKDMADPLNWSRAHKWSIIAILSSINTIGNLATVLCLPAVPQMMRDLHTDDRLFSTLLASVWEIGEAVGPLITAPLSEIYGRSPVYNTTNTLFVIFSVACALSTSPGMLMGFRVLNGIGDASMALNACIAGDLFHQEQRGLPIAVLSFPPLLGPVLGPIIGGYLTQAAGWRWAFWFSAITGGVCQLMFLLVFRETYRPQLLRQKASRLRRQAGDESLRSKFDFDRRSSRRQILQHGFTRPVAMFCKFPAVTLLALQASLTYGYMYIFFTTLTPVFEQVYGFSQGAAGLSFLGLSIGMVIGVATCALTLDRLLSIQRRKKGVAAPEQRLLPMAIGAVIFPCGLFLYGWTTWAHVFYIVPMVGTATVGFGYFITNIPLQAYLVDTYQEFATSAIAATVVLRCVVATVLPLAAPALFTQVGLGWGNSILGFIAILFIPIPLLLLRHGSWLSKGWHVRRLEAKECP